MDVADFKVMAFKAVLDAGAIDRLLQYLESDCESRVLGTQVIREIGYESYPQFSREFKHYFGHSPSKTTALWADTMDS